MKKSLIPLILILSAFFLFGCNAANLLPADDAVAPTEMPEVTTEEAPTLAETMESEPDPMDAEDSDLVMDMSSNCYHPFFPITEGADWIFQLSSGESYTMTVTNVTNESFTLTQDFADSDLVMSVDWFCSGDGLLVGDFAQLDFLNQSGGEDGMEMTFDTLSWEGETLPAEDLFEVGYEWTATYNLKGDINMEGVVSTAEATVTIDYVIAAIEEVTVPAGTFPQAYRVDSDGEISMMMEFAGTSMPLTGFNFGSSTWYVENIGLVKTADDFTGYSSGMELIDSNLLGN